jgi:RNA polymerase sigma-70 factor (ECF subfamily)
MRNRKPVDTIQFEDIFERHKDQVINICHRLVGDRDEAEDLCQEVFFRVYRSLRTFKHRSKISTWIYRIAVNQSLNHIRNRKQRRRMSSFPNDQSDTHDGTLTAVAPPGEQPDLSFEKKEMQAIVWNAVQALPKNQRIVLILQKYEGFSSKEIAEIMDWTLSSVQSRIHRAKENLYKKLLPYLGEL